MKKILAILMALVIMLSFAACGSSDESETETTTATTEAVETTTEDLDEPISVKRHLLNEILATSYLSLSLGDESYESVVNYIQEHAPDAVGGVIEFYRLEDDYTLEFNTSTRKLVLRHGDYFRETLCENIDYPNVHSGTENFTIINNTSFYKSLNKIEVWQFGQLLWEVELPSSDIEILGSFKTIPEYMINWRIIVRSGSTIGYIATKGADFEFDVFSYEEIVSDCVGLIEKDLCSLWYVNKDSELIHVNLINFEKENIAKNVTNLVDVHDGVYSVAWREKGSLEWHEPKFLISEDGEKTPWSEHGGM